MPGLGAATPGKGMDMFKRLTIACAAAAILMIGAATGESKAQSKKGLIDVTFSLDFIVLGRHAIVREGDVVP